MPSPSGTQRVGASRPSSGPRRPYIGGQAVLEGVMMRAPHSFAVVVRRRDGSLHVRERVAPAEVGGLRRWPFVRGLASLVDSLRMGNDALRFSLEQMEQDLSAEASSSSSAGTAAGAKGRVGGTLSGMMRALATVGWTLAVLATSEGSTESGAPFRTPTDASTQRSRSLGWSVMGIALVFFVALPQVAAAALNRGLGFGLAVQSPAFQAMTGVLKLAIVVGYLLAVRRVPEIRRVFQYHGAEHKTISTYEAGEELTVANARAKTTLHPRCGTTFLVMVAIVSVLVFTGVGALLPRIQTGNFVLDNMLFFAEKLPFLPLLVGFTFELQRFSAKYCLTGPLRALLWPGFLVQRITTSEPDDSQLEVALASLRVTLFRESSEEATGRDAIPQTNPHARQSAPSESEHDVRFPDFDSLLGADRLRASDASDFAGRAIVRPSDASDRTARSARPSL